MLWYDIQNISLSGSWWSLRAKHGFTKVDLVYGLLCLPWGHGCGSHIIIQTISSILKWHMAFLLLSLNLLLLRPLILSPTAQLIIISHYSITVHRSLSLSKPHLTLSVFLSLSYCLCITSFSFSGSYFISVCLTLAQLLPLLFTLC